MDKSTTPLALSIFTIALVIWILTEVVARGLARAGVKDRPIAQFGLHILPLALGVLIVTFTNVLALAMDLFGYTPKAPPEMGDLTLLGLLAGAAAVLAHDKIGRFIRLKFPLDDQDMRRPMSWLLPILCLPAFLACSMTAEYTIEREVRFKIRRQPVEVRMFVDGQERCRAVDPHGTATLRIKLEDIQDFLEKPEDPPGPEAPHP